jgi:hypothetical protein
MGLLFQLSLAVENFVRPFADVVVMRLKRVDSLKTLAMLSAQISYRLMKTQEMSPTSVTQSRLKKRLKRRFLICVRPSELSNV